MPPGGGGATFYDIERQTGKTDMQNVNEANLLARSRSFLPQSGRRSFSIPRVYEGGSRSPTRETRPPGGGEDEVFPSRLVDIFLVLLGMKIIKTGRATSLLSSGT